MTAEKTVSSPAQITGRQGRAVPRWVILTIVCVAQLMVVLDATVVNVMLPQIRHDLGLSAVGQQWVLSIYVLVFGGLMLLGGRLTDVIGRRRILLCGLFLFTVGSVLVATAGDAAQLLPARALQGLAAAGASPAALSILLTTYPEKAERAKALGIWAVVLGVGASIGTLVGGALAEVDWRLAFYINVPIGIVLLAGAARYIPAGRPANRLSSDYGGAITVTGGILLLAYGIVSAGMHGWTSPWVLGSFAASVILLAAFVLVERQHPMPLVPLGVLRQRALLAGVVSQVLVAGIMLTTFYLLPQYMQSVLGYSPLKSGLAYIPTSVAMITVSGLVPKLIAKFGPIPTWVSGLVLAGIPIWLMSRAPVHDGYWQLLFPVMALFGVGVVLSMLTVSVIGTAGATDSDAGITAALLNAATELGGALGLSVTATLTGSLAERLVAHGASPAAALDQGLHRGFTVLFIWIALGLVVGFVGFRRLPVAPTAESAGAEALLLVDGVDGPSSRASDDAAA